MSRSPARFTQADIARALRVFEQVHGQKATIEFTLDGTLRIVAIAAHELLRLEESILYGDATVPDPQAVSLRNKTISPNASEACDQLHDYYDRIGFAPKTMDRSELSRLSKLAEQKWLASIPGTPLNKREHKALLQFKNFELGILTHFHELRIGVDTGERLQARGFVEIRLKNPNTLEGYVITDAGHAASLELLRSI